MFNKSLLFAFLTSFLLSSFTMMEVDDNIKFVHARSISEVQAIAKQQNKPIFLDFTANWCMPCRNMEKNVFQNKKIATYMNQNFISYKVDVDTRAGKNIAMVYGVEYLPTLIVIAPDGKVIKKKASNLGKDGFMNFATQAKTESYYVMN